MLIPKHLREISDVINSSKTFEVAKIKCECGCSRFIVYKNLVPLNPTIKYGLNEIVREKDKLFLIKRNFWGKIIEKIECSDTFNEKPRNVIKVICQNCDSEYVLFDNYLHGYDAINNHFGSTTLHNASTEFKKVHPQSLEVFVKIHQDVSYDVFQKEFESLDFETYLNSFGSIEIYSITSNSQKIKICLEETS